MNTTRFNLLTVQRNLFKILIKGNILISICPVTDATASKAIDTTVVVTKRLSNGSLCYGNAFRGVFAEVAGITEWCYAK